MPQGCYIKEDEHEVEKEMSYHARLQPGLNKCVLSSMIIFKNTSCDTHGSYFNGWLQE